MHDSTHHSHRPTSSIRECECGNCGNHTLTVPGTKCPCGGSFVQTGEQSMRKALGHEDVDLRKGGLR